MREARTEDAAARFRSLIAFCSPDGLSVTRGAAAPGDTAATAAGDGGTSAAAAGAPLSRLAPLWM